MKPQPSQGKKELVTCYIMFQVCLQCIHQISRFHAFKTRVEKLDSHLHEYIKGLTVILEEPTITQIELPREITTTKLNRPDTIQHLPTVFNLNIHFTFTFCNTCGKSILIRQFKPNILSRK